MSEDDVKNLLTELVSIRKDITKLRSTLNELNENKEALFEEKSRTSKDIASYISQIRTLKKERDDYTRKVKSQKEERNHFNIEIKAKADELKNMLAERAELRKTQNIKGNPSAIMRKIEQLEFKIETEGMSFEVEKKLMNKINEMKKQLEGAKEFLMLSERIRKVKDELRNAKKNANMAHKIVQDNAQNSQERHEKILELSKKIDELRKKENELQAKFMEAKEEFNKVNDALKEKLVAMNKISDKLKEHKIEITRETKEKEKKTLVEKSKEVDEKIRSGKKLTTQDLLVYQKTLGDETQQEDSEKED